MPDTVLGIDIGGTKCAVVLGRPNGEILARREEPTRPEQGPDRILERLVSAAADLLRDQGASAASLGGIGISCGGPIDSAAGLVHSPPNLPGWDAVPARKVFEDAFRGVPVRLENDANATALAEWLFGAGKGARNMVFVTIGTGIGGGLILDGRLYRGTNDLAGELGHQTILVNGPRCLCGKRGCLEAVASGPAIARLAQDSLQYGRGRPLLAHVGGHAKDITARHVVEMAREGDDFSRRILDEAATYIGIGLANVIQILNPERIVLGTIAVHAGELILEPIRRAIAEYAWTRSADVCQVVSAALGDRAQDLAPLALFATTP